MSRWTRNRKLLLLAAACLVAAVSGATLASFSSTSSNSGNSFQAASSFGGPMQMSTGAYSGDNKDGRALTDPGFQPDLVIVKGNNTSVAVARSSTMSGDVSKPLSGATALTADLLQSLTTTGFTVGKNAAVNANSEDYTWSAFKAADGALKVGSYSGNNTAGRAISGLGFSPEVVLILPSGTPNAVMRVSGMTSTFRFDAETGAANRISSLDSDGFTVGNDSSVNTSGNTYHWVAFNELAGGIDVGSYSGDAADGRAISGPGFLPDFVMVRANDTATARRGAFTPGATSLGYSSLFNGEAGQTDGIVDLTTSGFEVGTDTAVNANGSTYHYLAVKNTGTGCAVHGTRYAYASDDSWVDESSASANNGSATTLRVQTKSAANQRALLDFALPGLPSGCTVSSAQLYVYNRTPVAGRTIEAAQVSGSWSESGVTWSNQPGVTGTAATAASTSTAGYMGWSVQSIVANMYSGGSGSSFRLRDQTEDNATGVVQQYDSSEGAVKPLVVVTTG